MSQTAAVGSPFRNRHFTMLWFAMLAFEVANLLMVQLPGFLTSIGLSEGFIGVMFSTSGVVALVARPLLGRIIDLGSRRTVLLAAGAIHAALLALIAIPDSLSPLLWVAFIGWRMAQIALFAIMLTAASDVLRPERRTQGLALFGLSGLLAMMGGGLIGDVVRSLVGFEGLFLASAALGGLSVAIKAAVPGSVFPEPSGSPRRSFWFALVQGDLLPLWLITFTFAVGIEALFTFLRTFVDEVGVGSFGSYLLVYGAMAAIVRIVGSSFMDLFDARRLMFVTTIAYGVGIGLLGVARSVTVFLVLAGLAGFAHGLLFPVITSQVVARARDSERGSAMSAFTALFDLALVTMAPVVGRIIDVNGYTAAFGVVGVAVVVGAFAYVAWDRRFAGTRFAPDPL